MDYVPRTARFSFASEEAVYKRYDIVSGQDLSAAGAKMAEYLQQQTGVLVRPAIPPKVN